MSRKKAKKTYSYEEKPRRGHIKPAFALVFLLVVLVFTISPWRTAENYGMVAEPVADDASIVIDFDGDATQPADGTAVSVAPAEVSLPAEGVAAQQEPNMAAEPGSTAVSAAAASVAPTELTLPNGKPVSSTDKRVDLTGIGAGEIPAAVQCLSSMPNVMVIELGSSSLTGSSLSALQQAAPEARFIGTVQVNGTPVSTRAQSLDLTGLSHDAVAETASALSCLSNLRSVNLGDSASTSGLSWSDIGAIEAACPNAKVSYGFSLYGRDFSTSTGYMDLSYAYVDDGGAAVREVLPYMTACTYVDMDSCGVSSPDMAAIRDAFPDKKVVWRISFGSAGVYSVRTDVNRILASKPSVGGTLNTGDVQCLRYCQDLMYLDLGHNDDIDDISFVRDLPRLEVLIVAMDFFYDLSPVADLQRLEYLEIQTTRVTDLTPLSGLKSLHHVNLCCLYDGIDLNPLMGMTQLERLWIGALTPVDGGQLEQLYAALPDTLIDTTAVDPHDHQWRQISWDIENTGVIVYHPRYIHLRDQFGYNVLAYSFNYLDPKYRA